jgi:hypothetical protein
MPWLKLLLAGFDPEPVHVNFVLDKVTPEKDFFRILLFYAVAQLVEALRYEPEGRGFDSRWSRWKFSVTKSFRSHCGPGVDSASNRNEYQESFLGVNTAGAEG